MADDTPAWESTPQAAKIKSLLLRGRNDEAKVLMRTANAEAGHRCPL